MLKKILKSDKGSTLIFTLMIFTVVSVLSLSVIFLSNSNFRRTNLEEKRTKAYYIARTGADALSEYIINEYKNYNPDINDDDKDKDKLVKLLKQLNLYEKGKSADVVFGDGYFNVEVIEENGECKVVSTGYVGNGKSGTVSQVAKVVLPEIGDDPGNSDNDIVNIFNKYIITSTDDVIVGIGDKGHEYGIYGDMIAKRNITIKNNWNRMGDLIARGSVTIGNNIDSIGEVLSGKEAEEKVEGQFKKIKELDIFKKSFSIGSNQLQVKGGKVEIITEDKKYQSIQVDSNNKLIIKTNSNKNINIYVQDIEVEDGAEISIEGNGKVYFYINNLLHFDTSSNSKNYSKLILSKDAKALFYVGKQVQFYENTKVISDNPNLLICLKQGGNFNMKDNCNFKGYIYAPNANQVQLFDTENSSNVKFTGAIIGKNIKVGGKSNYKYISPDNDILKELNNQLGIENSHESGENNEANNKKTWEK